MDWISVKDRMPEDQGQSILVYGILEHHQDHDIHIARFFIGVNEEQGNNQFWEYGWSYDISDVTHWMPLPQPPEVK